MEAQSYAIDSFWTVDHNEIVSDIYIYLRMGDGQPRSADHRRLIKVLEPARQWP